MILQQHGTLILVYLLKRLSLYFRNEKIKFLIVTRRFNFSKHDKVSYNVLEQQILFLEVWKVEKSFPQNAIFRIVLSMSCLRKLNRCVRIQKKNQFLIPEASKQNRIVDSLRSLGIKRPIQESHVIVTKSVL